eukprot:IDg15537t1
MSRCWVRPVLFQARSRTQPLLTLRRACAHRAARARVRRTGRVPLTSPRRVRQGGARTRNAPYYNAACCDVEFFMADDARVVFVCGADLAHAMADPACWPRRNVRRLASAATIAILRRAGAPDPPHAFEDADSFPRPTLVIDAPVLPGSSSDVRCVSRSGAQRGSRV